MELKKEAGSTGKSNSDLAALEEEAKGDAAAQKPAPEIPVDNVAMGKLYAQLWVSLFAFASKRLGEHWTLTQEEAEHLGLLTAPVADKYLKGAMNNPESLLIASVAFTVIPRLAIKTPKAEAPAK